MSNVFNQTPLQILTGFLGSGKTTLLNKVVNNPEMKGTVLIINEVGEIPIDNKLISGEKVTLPRYNFETGEREEGETIQIHNNEVLIFEGIHALNPKLTEKIPAENKFKIFVSALTSISLDNHNCIPNTDNRLIRRIVRDFKYRGYSAEDTIERWPDVMKGEEKWIVPFQEEADAMFNSAMIFELCVLKHHAIAPLSMVPQTSPIYSEAHRLLNFLSYFADIQENEIPTTSLLREFVGGSSFKMAAVLVFVNEAAGDFFIFLRQIQ